MKDKQVFLVLFLQLSCKFEITAKVKVSPQQKVMWVLGTDRDKFLAPSFIGCVITEKLISEFKVFEL